jgi:hypothetical protein
VMTGLVYPHDWDVGLQENTQMVKHYNKWVFSRYLMFFQFIMFFLSHMF